MVLFKAYISKLKQNKKRFHVKNLSITNRENTKFPQM